MNSMTMTETTLLNIDKELFKRFKKFALSVLKQTTAFPFFDGTIFSLVEDFCNYNLIPDSERDLLKEVLHFYKGVFVPLNPPEVEEFWFNQDEEKVRFLHQVDTELSKSIDNERVIEIVKRIITYVNLQNDNQTGICTVLLRLHKKDKYASKTECDLVYEKLYDFFMYNEQYFLGRVGVYWFPLNGPEACSLRVSFLNDFINSIS